MDLDLLDCFGMYKPHLNPIALGQAKIVYNFGLSVIGLKPEQYSRYHFPARYEKHTSDEMKSIWTKMTLEIKTYVNL